jgi:large subunit ribosomal protein L17
MRHRVAGKQLSRTTAHRRALRRNQALSLFEHGAIRTTDIKAKELRSFVEKIITIARKNTLAARRHVVSRLNDRAMADKENPDQLADKSVVQKLFTEIAPRYANRPGGYTRIIHISERRIGDAGKQVLLQLVEEVPAGGEQSHSGGARKTTSRRRRTAGKRAEAFKAALTGKGKGKAKGEAAG